MQTMHLHENKNGTTQKQKQKQNQKKNREKPTPEQHSDVSIFATPLNLDPPCVNSRLAL
jgi:hypothetical protein